MKGPRRAQVAKSPLTPEQEQELAEFIATFRHDPLGHVLAVYPWGEPGTDLEHERGPRRWQREFLERLGRRLRAGEADAQKAMAELGILFSEVMLQPIQEAVGSGHGVGKTTLLAWLVRWAMDTFEDCRGVVTANTDTQLRTKTWPELAKWHRLSLTQHWFHLSATRIHSLVPGHEDTWRIDIIPWDERNTEAFQGLHNKGKRVLILFDEASGIHDLVWEATEGALTDQGTEVIWGVFGNLTRTTGRFVECFGRYRHRWSEGGPVHLDSRTVEGTNLVLFEQWLKDHEFDGGEDSDFFRVRVRGLPPKASILQLISSRAVLTAQKRQVQVLDDEALVGALDVARGGDDNCVIRFRRGLDARSMPVYRIPGTVVEDSMRLVSWVAAILDRHKPDAFFVDATGVGGPIADRLQQLGYLVTQIQFAGAAPLDVEGVKCANMRAYMWVRLRNAIVNGLALPEDPVLERDLTNVEYGHNKHDQLQLEEKKHMKSRGLASPDDGDALAMLFAHTVPPKSSLLGGGGLGPTQQETAYNPFARRPKPGHQGMRRMAS